MPKPPTQAETLIHIINEQSETLQYKVAERISKGKTLEEVLLDDPFLHGQLYLMMKIKLRGLVEGF